MDNFVLLDRDFTKVNYINRNNEVKSPFNKKVNIKKNQNLEDLIIWPTPKNQIRLPQEDSTQPNAFQSIALGFPEPRPPIYGY